MCGYTLSTKCRHSKNKITKPFHAFSGHVYFPALLVGGFVSPSRIFTGLCIPTALLFVDFHGVSNPKPNQNLNRNQNKYQHILTLLIGSLRQTTIIEHVAGLPSRACTQRTTSNMPGVRSLCSREGLLCIYSSTKLVLIDVFKPDDMPIFLALNQIKPYRVLNV